ncbi:tRNA (adenosine(37)-N6)-threonylcarbamoyltransferase complex dimerization subunit type 1 TsaB [Lapillicoccus jejuensis]|uniref:tRNA threonylcarbamoyl adenosine modification protein YeaZ n=1 Tax=Lapillicoccus jejuensis TaxID=402171 RepID=A0A542E1V5_9MICO|nr:tRNA (adenosine(37)-N6)-threonylcarbamoyltransferase complex dimerization subunit type 1 TsaB [Lapillicoccus jejuensis]TQJ09316.1 tRNA threonylcarbamoyl adenosine modification protein YeaZ [Lapillicoccus jejuensis]
MLLLALDTSTTAITVALHDGSTVLAEATTLDARGHAEHLAPGVQRVLAQAGAVPADVTDVAVGLGPGPFTGLRVGIVTGRTLALAVGARVHGVGSLDALAAQAVADGLVGGGALLVATDARRKEVYWAAYDVVPGRPGGVERRGEPAVGRAADLPDDVRSLPTVGRGPGLYPDALTHGLPLLDVSAGALASLVAARLGAGEVVDEQEALYLRRPDAVPSAARP